MVIARFHQQLKRGLLIPEAKKKKKEDEKEEEAKGEQDANGDAEGLTNAGGSTPSVAGGPNAAADESEEEEDEQTNACGLKAAADESAKEEQVDLEAVVPAEAFPTLLEEALQYAVVLNGQAQKPVANVKGLRPACMLKKLPTLILQCQSEKTFGIHKEEWNIAHTMAIQLKDGVLTSAKKLASHIDARGKRKTQQ